MMLSRLGKRTIYALLAAMIVEVSPAAEMEVLAVDEAAVIRVREEGDYAIVAYTTEGKELRRYTGFAEISDLAVYDRSTLLITEPGKNRITALDLDGHVTWTTPVHWPRCVQATEPDRFLTCQDHPPALVEVDRAGRETWRLAAALSEVAGAAWLPGGNVAVAAGRPPDTGIYVFHPDGKRLWTGGAGLPHRGLALLPTGEIAAAGLGSTELTILKPFSEETRTLSFCCHSYALSANEKFLLASAAEQQQVRGWQLNGGATWQFKTSYPPAAIEMLDDGTVLAALYLEPDATCLDAAPALERSARPLAPYWVWLLTSVAAALLVVALVQHRTLWRYTDRRAGTGGWHAIPQETAPDAQGNAPKLGTLRRAEVGLYTAAALALATTAALHYEKLLPASRFRFGPEAAAVGLAGLLVALLRLRTPGSEGDWRAHMASPRKMGRPTAAMWILWAIALPLLIAALRWVTEREDNWALAAWAGGLVLLVGGTIEPPHSIGRRASRMAIGSLLLLFLALLAIRLYRLEEYPANLHQDMALWTFHTGRLLDGDYPTMFGDGYAQISLAGHLWSALWTAIAGRSISGGRIASVAGSLLTLWATFLLTRRLYASWTAAIASIVVLGVNHAFLHFSRIQAYMDPVPFHVLAVLGLVAGVETGRYGWFALAGFAGGYSALTYHAGRITPLVLLPLAGLLFLRHPRTVIGRWPGFLLLATVFFATVGPYALLYATGRMYPFGREEVYPFFVGQQIDFDLLRQTLAVGLAPAFGSFWSVGDSSTQYGSIMPVFLPPESVLLGMMGVAALLRPADVRGLLLLTWAAVVIAVGGALTMDPRSATADSAPFWPRFVIAFVPASIAIGVCIAWLGRSVAVVLGRSGPAIASAGTAALLAFTSWKQLSYLANQERGFIPGQSRPTRQIEWPESIMGRDIQRWDAGALIYIVSENPRSHSCRRALTQYYATGRDVHDARDIRRYMPFEDPRTIVCYFPPEVSDQIAAVLEKYPNADVKHLTDNFGQTVLTRLVIRAPHS
jgi:hypothetical protein